MDNEYYDIAQLAHKVKLTRQAVHTAIYSGRLKARKIGNKYFIDVSDARHWIKNKHKNSYKIFDGKPLYDPEKGRYSIAQASKIAKIPRARIYYIINRKYFTPKKCDKKIVLDDKNIDFLRRHRKGYFNGQYFLNLCND